MTFTLAPKVLGVGPMRLLIVAILFCVFTETLSSAADTAQSCRLRFIDAATLKPISLQKFLFIPRKIFAKMAPGSPDPNLEFAKPFTTDRDGYFQISEALIKELTDDGKIYVNGEEKKEIVRIDVATNKVDARWPMPGCTSPHGLAIDTAGHQLFSTCANKVMTVVDTTSGAVVATLPIGQGTDAAAFDPARKRAFSSNGEGTITVVDAKDPTKMSVIETVPTRVTGRTMGIDPATGRLFVAAADIDPKAPVPAGPNGRPGRPRPVPGSLKLLFLDPVR